MGIFASRASTPVDSLPSSSSHNVVEDVLKDFDLSAPTAAVIGAGIAGVHVAYELAQLGFRVTVFDQRRTVASGETQYALPFVGVGLLHPYIHTLRMSRELLRGTLTFACPDIIFWEDSWNSFFASAIHRWLWARRWGTLSEEQVMRYTNNLSRLSVDVVEDLCRRHQSLTPHVLSRDVSVGVFSPRGNGTVTTGSDVAVGETGVMTRTTAHQRPLMIDPVGWTRALARICHKSYGVEFALGEKLLDSTVYLRYDVEMVSTLRFSREVDGRKEYHTRHFDLVVLTTGAQTGSLTWNSSQLPIIGLSGCSVALQASPSGALAPLKRMLTAASPGFLSLSQSGHLVAYETPRNEDGVENTEGSLVLQGLLSFDTTTKTGFSVTGTLRRLERYLRVKSGLELPLLQVFQQQQQGGMDVDVREATTPSYTHAARYIRAFTPDGVPLISNNGAAFNFFVCAGFGDHAADMAPGSAKVLAKLVETGACVMQHQDEEEMRSRCDSIKPLMTRGRLDHVLQELQLLFNGFLSSSYIPCGQKMETFAQNPFSSARFNGVVKDTVPDVSHTLFLHHLSEMETRLVRAFEPWGHYINQQAIRWARRDNMPDWLRTIVYYYFNEEEDDEEMLRGKQRYAEEIRRISQQFEGKSLPSSRDVR